MASSFFKGELAQFKVEKVSPYAVKGKKIFQQLDPVATANRLGSGTIAFLFGIMPLLN